MGIVRSKLNENPDGVQTPTRYLSWREDDAMPFGYYGGKLYLNTEGGMHGNMPGVHDEVLSKLPYGSGNYGQPRTYLEDQGRLWKNHKIMSFWKYPPKEKFKKIIDEIGKAIGEPNMFNDPEWKVEIVKGQKKDPYKDGSGPEKVRDINKDWDWKEWWYDTEIISLRDYVGSNQRSKEELAKQHVESPMTKMKRPDKTDYVKAGQKKHKPLAWKQAMYAESTIVRPKINESPDMIQADNLYDIAGIHNLGFTDKNALAFGYYRDNMMIGKGSETHAEAAANRYGFKNKHTGSATVQRKDLKYAGRLWPDQKIISFWNYPPKNELKKVLDDIVDENRKKYGDSYYLNFDDPNWSIEIISKEVPKKAAQEYGHNEWMDALDSTLIPLSDYTGSEDQSKEEQGKEHIKSPMEKSRKPSDSAYFKVRDSKEKPLAWKQALVKSESMTLHEKLLMGEPVTIEELRDILHKKVLNFEFIKLDGEVRPAKGTTMMKYIPKEEHPTGEHPSSDKVAAFYDLSKDAWRSVSNRSNEIVLVQDEETGKIKVQVSDKVPKEEPKEKKPEISKVPGADPRPIPPKTEPVVRPSIRPEVTPEIPDIEDVEVEEPETPLDIQDPNITADDVKDKDIVAPETEEPEVELPEPQETPPVPPETPMEPAVSPSIKPEAPDEELPPEEDITFPEDDDEDIM